MEKLKQFLIIFFLGFQLMSAQNSLKEVLNKYNDNSIPYIKVEQLTELKSVVIVDARERNEFTTSHLKNAVFAGFNSFDLGKIEKQIINKNQEIVVYCSIGVRSEIIAKKLKKAGYNNVKNLYGGIFEWSNNNYKLIDSVGKETKKVHTFNKEWSKWLKKGEKIYD